MIRFSTKTSLALWKYIGTGYTLLKPVLHAILLGFIETLHAKQRQPWR